MLDQVWKTDENRYTVFHMALRRRQEDIFKHTNEIRVIKDLIAIYKDDNGNNMLHLANKLATSHRGQLC